MSKINGNKEAKRKAKNPKIIRINLGLVIGIIAIVFSLFSFALTYKLAIIGTQKLETFGVETLIDEGISTVASTTTLTYWDNYGYMGWANDDLSWEDVTIDLSGDTWITLDADTFSYSGYKITSWNTLQRRSRNFIRTRNHVLNF